MSDNERQYAVDEERFKRNIEIDRMSRIASVTTTINAYLYPHYLKFKELTSDCKIGVFILDARGIYTPIETGDYGVIHVERLPIVKPAVYGITDLSNSAVLTEDRATIIFQGVIFTEKFGWKFINEGFQVKPIAGFTPSNTKRLILTRSTTVKTTRKELYEDYDDDDD
jgi:hypothetical protein